MKILIKIGSILLALLLIFGLLLLILTLTAYAPPERETLLPLNEGNANKQPPESLSILTWNIGYCGIDAETDVFIEGGTMSRARSPEAVEEALKGVTDFLSSRLLIRENSEQVNLPL